MTFQFCDKSNGKITDATEEQAYKWARHNYIDTDMLIDSMKQAPQQWYNGTFLDCRFIGEPTAKTA